MKEQRRDTSRVRGIEMSTDPLAFGAVASLFFVVTLAACYVPARRAMRVDPLIAMRAE
jgi:ABC-type lipoprotein release transport system permease subunit